MFGSSAERNEVERPPRIAQCGHAPAALSLCGIALKNPKKTDEAHSFVRFVDAASKARYQSCSVTLLIR